MSLTERYETYRKRRQLSAIKKQSSDYESTRKATIQLQAKALREERQARIERAHDAAKERLLQARTERSERRTQKVRSFVGGVRKLLFEDAADKPKSKGLRRPRRAARRSYLRRPRRAARRS